MFPWNDLYGSSCCMRLVLEFWKWLMKSQLPSTICIYSSRRDFRFLNSLESSPPASLPDLKKLSKFAKPSRTIGENISYRITPRDTIFPIPRNRLGNPGHDDCVGNQAIWNLSASLGSRGARGALFVTSIRM